MESNNIILRNFWQDDDITKKFILNLFAECNLTSKKIVISSVFIPTKLTSKIASQFAKWSKFNLEKSQKRLYNIVQPSNDSDTVNIWYTGENLRPPSDHGWNLLLTFETDESIPNNVYLPFWATRLGTDIDSSIIAQKYLLKSREVESSNRKFACAIIGNPEPTRMRAIKYLNSVGEVDLFGRVFNNIIEEKNKVLGGYNFNICFENDLYPGYVTEKVIDSWRAGSIPVWWGLDPLGYINPKAVINFAKLGFEEGVKYIADIKSNSKKIRSIQSEPLLQKPFNYVALKQKIIKSINR